MPRLTRESDEPSIVVIGEFDPRSFHPAKLAQDELLPAAEARMAVLEGSPIAMEFKLPVASDSSPWLHVQVFPQRFLAKALDSGHATSLFDLVVGCLSPLTEPKVTALGLNRVIRYKFESESDWHALGDRLLPKQAWSDAGLLAEPELLERVDPGLSAIAVLGKRPDSMAKYLRVTLRPTQRKEVAVDINEHFEIDGSNLLQTLKGNWDALQQFSSTFADTLVGKD
jgi:hypothetical protein